MEKSEFQNLLTRYNQGLCSDEEIRKIHLWFSQLNEHSDLDIPVEDRDAIKSRILDSINQNTKGSDTDKRVETRVMPAYRNWIWAAAAAMTGLFVGYYFLFSGEVPPSKVLPVLAQSIRESIGSSVITHENNDQKLMKIVLDDGSRVTLLPRGKLSYKSFSRDKAREVTLVGNAFFDISRDTSRPFLINHGNLVTSVLGTSFWIKSDPEKRIQEVEVVSGTVKLYERKKTKSGRSGEMQETILTRNQRATYFEDRGDLLQTTNPVSIPTEASARIRAQNLDFQNVNLDEIKLALEQTFDTKILLTDPGLSNCRFTGDVSNLPLNDILHLVCKSIRKLEFEIVGNQFIIHGKGCN